MHKNIKCVQHGNVIKVIISTSRGAFFGKAKCHPDDVEHFSQIFGGEIAEGRAWIRYWKDVIREAQNTLAIQQQVYNSISPYDKSARNSVSKVMAVQEQKISEAKTYIDTIATNIQNRCELREKVISKASLKKN